LNVTVRDCPKATSEKKLQPFAPDSFGALIEILQRESPDGFTLFRLPFSNMDSLRVEPDVQNITAGLLGPFAIGGFIEPL
jgi:hypothetical protein